MIYLLLGLSYLAASSLVLSVVLAYQEATPDNPPPSTRHHLLATSVFTLYSLSSLESKFNAGFGIPVRAAVSGVLLPLAHLAPDGQEAGAEQHPVHIADGGSQQGSDK